jgi:uncharacterized protein YqfA (UPF0365 family)
MPAEWLSIVPILVIIVLLLLLFWAVPVGLWIAARFAGVRVRLIGDLLFMRLRRVNPPVIVNAQINATKAGLQINIADLEAHYLAGGTVPRVVNALIAADKAKIELPLQQATAIDLAGRDVLDAVQVSVNPRVITTPRITAVALDGVQLIATVRITVRAISTGWLEGRAKKQ